MWKSWKTLADMNDRNKGGAGEGRQPFLIRLLHDRRGNTLAIVAAALIPLMLLIGSGVDLARTYMAQARLQLACDAAALAGRRLMGSGALDSGDIAEANKFFNFNFNTGTAGVDGTGAFGTKGFTPVVSTDPSDATTVRVSANTTIPTTIMQIAGYKTLPISATCSSRQDFVNTDIVLVLDTTGSMADKAVYTDTDTKIVALRKAVLALFDTLKPVQDQLDSVGLRLRYSIVPYSSSVNVGKILRDFNSSFIQTTSYQYQSRMPNGTSTTTSSSTCNNNGGLYSGGTCYYFKYGPQTINIADYVAGKSVPLAPIIGGPAKSATWAGCIEERQTTNTLTSSTANIPAAAYDLDIDKVPTTDNTTKWKPFWPEVEYLPTNAYQYGGEANKPQWACPAEAVRLKEWARADLSTYLNTLSPNGGTYHDNGIIWGGTFISPDGIFKADNPNTYNNMPVSRFIIFMTDGLLDTGYDKLYTTYGIEKYDARVTPGGSSSNETDQGNRHRQRFKLVCSTVKAKGVSVWVLAFAQTPDADLSSCASNSNQVFTASNSSDLNDKFVQIGKNIGALRLTQ